MNKCDHTVAVVFDYAETALYTKSDYKKPLAYGTEWPYEDHDGYEFNYCPDCGEKLKEESKTC